MIPRKDKLAVFTDDIQKSAISELLFYNTGYYYSLCIVK